MTEFAPAPRSREMLPAPQSFEEAMSVAKVLAQSSLVPKQFQNAPQNIVVAMMWSHSLQIPVVQGLQYIAVVNGRPSLYGDGMLAVCMGSGMMIDIEEKFVGEGDSFAAVCTVTRRGKATPVVGQFSIKDAHRAGLWGKPGPWSAYPKRMLKMRARAYALRDAFPDVLSGMSSAEEQADVIEGEVSETAPQSQEMPPVAEPTKKMPRRRTAKAAPAVENNPSPAADFVPQPQADPVPVKADADGVVIQEDLLDEEQPKSDEEAVASQDPAPAQSNDIDLSEIVAQVNTATSYPNLVKIWQSLPASARANQAVVEAFKAKTAQFQPAKK